VPAHPSSAPSHSPFPSRSQCLEELLVGPVQVGTNRFTLQAPAPDLGSIKPCDLLGVTVVLITGSYCGSEFIRIGYYVNNSHSDPEVNAAATDGTLLTEMQELPPGEITRSILADKPRVTRFLVDWNKGHQLAVEAGEYMMEGVEDDAETSGELSFSSSQATKGLLDYAPTGVHSGEVMMDVMEVRY
jgi:histone chaperone ASF1